MSRTVASFNSLLIILVMSCYERLILLVIYILSLLLMTLFGNVVLADTNISSVRVWPASEYTRLTLESPTPIKYSLSLIKNPDRVVLDLENVALNLELKSLPSKINATDPYIQALRIGNFKPGTLRLVLDLKTEVVPQAFLLKPVTNYSYRLVLDIYPAIPSDPMMALLQKERNIATQTNIGISTNNIDAKFLERNDTRNENIRKTEPEANRLITIVIDPGHGGEDSGAMSRKGTQEKDSTLAIARKLKVKIDAESNMRGALTRDGDYFISLPMRLVKARQVNADLFVSVHADAFIKQHARGSSVFALSESGATSAAAS